MEELLYDASSEMTQTLLERYRLGDLRPLCHECREDLIIVLDEEAMRRTGRHAGVYCPNGHIEVLFELRSVHERIHRTFERLRKDKPRYFEAPILEVQPDDEGWLTCPACGVRFTLRDRRVEAGPGLWRHNCGQRVRRESGM